MATFSDTFNRTNAATLGTSSSGQAWTEWTNGFNIASNVCVADNLFACAAFTPEFASGDHYAEMKVTTLPQVGSFFGLIVRAPATLGTTNTGTGEFIIGMVSGAATLNTWSIRTKGDASATLTTQVTGSTSTLNVGDVIRVECSGTTVTMYQNGVQRVQWTSATLTAQKRAGIYFDLPTGGTTFGAVDDFSAGTAITHVATSAVASGTTSATATLPTGTTSGDVVYLNVVNKPATTSPPVPTGWSTVSSASVGTGTNGAGSGPVRITTFKRTYDGVWTMPAVTSSGAGSVILAAATSVRAATGEIFSAETTTSGSDTTSATGFSVTGGADITLAGGDLVLTVAGTTSNVTATVPTLTATGATLSTVTERADAGTNSGNDGGLKVHTATVASGPSSAAPVHGLTLSGASTGGALFLRLRALASAPVANAGADATIDLGATFSRTGTESGEAPTSRSWTVLSGPAEVSTTLSTDATVVWTPDTSGSYVLRYSATNASGTGTDDVAVTVSATPATPVLLSRWVGIGDSTTVRVSAKTVAATSCRLKVGTDSGVTAGVVFGAAATPNAQGVSHMTCTGLTAGVNYYYRVEMTDVGSGTTLDAGTVGRARTAPTGQTNFAFNFGSCCDGADSASFTAIATRADDLFLYIGDFYYFDASGTTLANFRNRFNAKIQAPNLSSVLSTTPSSYTPSDHDGMNNNTEAGTDPTAWTNWNQVYRELVPTPTLPGGTTGVYYTFTWGRVRFIQLDDRSFKSATDDPDDSSKTALGATQKQWLKDTIDAATEPAIVIVQEGPWIAAPTSDDDAWGGYDTERTELGAHIAASGKNIVMLAGDMHALAADDGTNNEWGGFAVFQAAPFLNESSIKGGPYTAGPYPASVTSGVQQYGRVVVTDSGSQISFAFTGYSSDNTVRVTTTKTFDIAVTSPVSRPVAMLNSAAIHRAASW